MFEDVPADTRENRAMFVWRQRRRGAGAGKELSLLPPMFRELLAHASGGV